MALILLTHLVTLRISGLCSMESPKPKSLCGAGHYGQGGSREEEFSLKRKKEKGKEKKDKLKLHLTKNSAYKSA